MAWRLSFVSLILLLTGCAVRQAPGTFRTVLSPSCLTAPLVMKGCSSSTDLTRCRLVEVRYRKGCEQIQVNGAKLKSEKK